MRNWKKALRNKEVSVILVITVRERQWGNGKVKLSFIPPFDARTPGTSVAATLVFAGWILFWQAFGGLIFKGSVRVDLV